VVLLRFALGEAGEAQEAVDLADRRHDHQVVVAIHLVLAVVRIGIVGLGQRGPGAVDRLSKIEGVEIKALCDLMPDRVDKMKKELEGTKHKPEGYSGNFSLQRPRTCISDSSGARPFSDFGNLPLKPFTRNFSEDYEIRNGFLS